MIAGVNNFLDYWLVGNDNLPMRENFRGFQDADALGDVPYPNKCPRCIAAEQLWSQINYHLVPAKDDRYHTWEKAVNEYKSKARASAAAYAVEVGKLGVSLVSAFGPQEKVKTAIIAVRYVAQRRVETDRFAVGKTIEAIGKAGNGKANLLAAVIFAAAKAVQDCQLISQNLADS